MARCDNSLAARLRDLEPGALLVEASEIASERQFENSQPVQRRTAGSRFISDGVLYAIYAAALALAISVWFVAIRAPLWLDETGSYWQISAGFSEIWSRQFNCFPAFTYILWLSTRLIGTSEFALRIPSLLAMLGAVCLFYLAARELFDSDRDIAIISTIIVCLHPIAVYTSIDVRPYAFAALATNAAILIVVRLRRHDSNWLAAMFGLSAICILYFQYLNGVILPALVICFFAAKTGSRRTMWRQFGIAFAVFAVGFLLVIPGLRYLLLTRGTHVSEAPPKLESLIWTLMPGPLLLVLGGTLLAALVTVAMRKTGANSSDDSNGWRLLLCGSLALIPILILYGVSRETSLRVFSARYRLVAVPGIALCWGLLIRRYLSRTLRLLFCVSLVIFVSYSYFSSPYARQHSYTWKYALAFAEKNASLDNSPVVICSDFIESDYAPMPVNSAKTSVLFAPLSYYKLTVPVVPLPRALNAEAIRVGSQFLQDATQKRQRFFALAYQPSYKTLTWLTQSASENYDVHELGVFDGVAVLEFAPRAQMNASR
jgi:hypothetical protein